jgi:hypothetical protein
MSLGILVPPFDIPATLQFGISASPFGTDLGSGTGTLSPNVFLNSTTSGNSSLLFLYSSSFTFPSIDLAAGTYWITLFNGIDNTGFVLAWDVETPNGGPSKAFFQNTNRPIDSESFSLDGTAVVPEPSTMLLFGSGSLLLGIIVHRKQLSAKAGKYRPGRRGLIDRCGVLARDGLNSSEGIPAFHHSERYGPGVRVVPSEGSGR